MYTYRRERCIPFNRTNGHQQARAEIRNPPNRTTSSYYGPRLPLHMRQREPQGLADFFVLKHTTDKSLARYLLAKRGFVARGYESPRPCRVTAPSENINQSNCIQVAPRRIQQAHSLASIQCHTLFCCAHCGEIIGLTPPL